MREVLLHNSINLLKRKLRPNKREWPDQGLKDSKVETLGQEPSSSHQRQDFQQMFGPRVQCRDQVRRKKVDREPYTPCYDSRMISIQLETTEEKVHLSGCLLLFLRCKHTCRCTNRTQDFEARCLLTTNRSLVTTVAPSYPQAPVWCWLEEAET